MVWQRLHAHHLLLPALHGPSLYFLQPQNCLYLCGSRVRGRLCNLRCCAQFGRLHCWPCYCWIRSICHLLRRYNHHYEPRPAAQATDSAGLGRCYLRHSFSRRSSSRWRLYIKGHLEMVLLHQSSHRRSCRGHSAVHPQNQSTSKSQYAMETASQAA